GPDQGLQAAGHPRAGPDRDSSDAAQDGEAAGEAGHRLNPGLSQRRRGRGDRRRIVADAGGISGLANRVGDVARIMVSPGGASLPARQEQFSGIMTGAKAGAQTPQERARTAAEQLVATALVQPVLKQLRESNNAAPPFAPNQAERTFRSLFDAAIAQRM